MLVRLYLRIRDCIRPTAANHGRKARFKCRAALAVGLCLSGAVAEAARSDNEPVSLQQPGFIADGRNSVPTLGPADQWTSARPTASPASPTSATTVLPVKPIPAAAATFNPTTDSESGSSGSQSGVPSLVDQLIGAQRGKSPPAGPTKETETVPKDTVSNATWYTGVSGLWQQAIATNVDGGKTAAGNLPTAMTSPMTDAASASASPLVPPIDPFAAANDLQSSAAALWRPLVGRQELPDAAATSADVMTSPRGGRMPTEANAPTIAETPIGSFMLGPFYSTNGELANDRPGEHGPKQDLAAAGDVRHDLEATLEHSSLVQQLGFVAGGDLVDRSPHAGTKKDADLATYLQEQPPEPADMDRNSSPELIPEPPAIDKPPGEPAAKDDSLAEADKLGKAPEDRSLEFLRTETVLLKPGENQFDIGINYLLTETDFPILLVDDMGDIIAVDKASFRIRELTVPMQYRVGLLPRVQGFIGAPIGWSNTQLAFDTFDAFQNDGGFGDLDFGLTAQLVDASANCPYVIGTLQATAPTGGDPFTGALALAPTAPSLGQGFWSIAGNVLFIQPYDPVVVFYGLGTEQFFSRHYLGLDIEPGAQYNYTFGVGFAVNERITLSTRFTGSYVEEIKVNGERRFGTNLEPMSIRFSATISQPCDRLVEPFVEFGITDEAVSSFLGVTWTFSPKSHRSPPEAAPQHAKK